MDDLANRSPRATGFHPMADGAWAVEVDSPSGWTLAEGQAYAERYHGLGDGDAPP